MPISPQTLFVTFLALWLALVGAGTFQYRRVRNLTIDLVLSEFDRMPGKGEGISLLQFYNSIYPKWELLVKQNAWFIINKRELFPVIAKPDTVRNRMKFTAAWVGAFLTINNRTLSVEPELSGEINAIVALAAKPGNRNEQNRNRRK